MGSFRFTVNKTSSKQIGDFCGAASCSFVLSLAPMSKQFVSQIYLRQTFLAGLMDDVARVCFCDVWFRRLLFCLLRRSR